MVGTTTIFLRHNDLGARLHSMTKEDLRKMDYLSPYREEKNYRGWSAPMELHNGNVYVLVFWKGKLMRMEDAPETLSRKYYHKYSGKTLNVYEWTVLKRMILKDIEKLDKKFKRLTRKKNMHVGNNTKAKMSPANTTPDS